jgi:hypothetical protein
MDEMKWFGLVVRGFGMTAVFSALHYSATALNFAMQRNEGLSIGGTYGREYVVLATLFVALGVYLLRGAPGLEKFCFPASSDNSYKDETDNE